MTFVPGIDLGVTGAAPITDIGRSLDPDAPIVLLDADTGERHPYWAELDTWTMNQARPRARRAAGAEPRRGSPLRRRAAEPHGRERKRDRGVRRVRAIP